MQPFHVQLLDLTLIQLTNWRWSWRGSLIIGTIAPIFFILSFGMFARSGGPDALAYVLTGNLVLSLLFDGLGKVSNNFAFMRANGTLDFFATLPIQRVSLIVASVTAFFILSLPSVSITLLLGAWILGLSLSSNPLILVVIPLTSLSLCGLGALIGLTGRTPEAAGSLSNLVSFVLFGFGPVLIPADRLPEIVKTISLLSPTTYAASALRQVVLNIPDRIPLVVDLIVLVAMTVGLLWLVTQKLDWRAHQ